jgi:rare lipoprotein A
MARRLALVTALACALSATAGWAAPKDAPRHAKAQVGKASIYAKRFAGRRMADGERMDPRGDNAASKTLPLGTKALVTNLENGRSALVTIEDRGPHVPGRIVDLSPASAEKIGLTREQGVAHVEVRPVQLPGDTEVAGR